MLSAFDLVAVLLVLTAAFGWINHRIVRLPHTIGLLVMGLGASLVLIGVELAFPPVLLYEDLAGIIRQIDFQATVLNGMLAFLLFAGALHVNLAVLRERSWAVASMATLGTLISTAIVGIGFWLASRALGVPIPVAWALVFGALISPTDPVAVISTLKAVRVPETLEIDMTGESLFNDGVGVVVFTILVAAATGVDGGALNGLHIGRLFLVEALGGALLGLVCGYLAYRAMRAIDDYTIEVLISLALRSTHSFVRGTIPVLTWGGLRGGISIALALSLPEVAEKSVILAATYAVVLFTVIVQGLSLRALVKRAVG